MSNSRPKVLGVYTPVINAGAKIIPVKGHERRLKSLLYAAASKGFSVISIPNLSASREIIKAINPDIIISDLYSDAITRPDSFCVVIHDDVHFASDDQNADLYVFPSGGEAPPHLLTKSLTGIMAPSTLKENQRGTWSFSKSEGVLFVERGDRGKFWGLMNRYKEEASDLGYPVTIIERDKPLPQQLLIEKMLGACAVFTTASTTAKESIFLGVPTIVVEAGPDQKELARIMAQTGLAYRAGNPRLVELAASGMLSRPLPGPAGSIMTTEELFALINLEYLEAVSRKRKPKYEC